MSDPSVPRSGAAVATAPGAEGAGGTDTTGELNRGEPNRGGAPEGQARTDARRRKLAQVLRIEWLGQTAASLCWIASVFACGIGSVGDWLQLCAASAWLAANVAAAIQSD